MADFLKDLPTRNSDNFSRFQPHSLGHKANSSSSTTPSNVYVAVNEPETAGDDGEGASRLIVTEKTNILLRSGPITLTHSVWSRFSMQ